MNETIGRLFQIETDANHTLDIIPEKKQELKASYDQKKEAYRQQAIASYEEKRQALQSEAQQSQKDKLTSLGQDYNDELESINDLAQNRLDEFTDRLLDKIKELGVHPDE